MTFHFLIMLVPALLAGIMAFCGALASESDDAGIYGCTVAAFVFTLLAVLDFYVLPEEAVAFNIVQIMMMLFVDVLFGVLGWFLRPADVRN